MANLYFPVLLLFVIAVAVPLGLLCITTLLGPRDGNSVKQEVYECGISPKGVPRGRLSIKFYRVAVLFLLFNVEASLLFPWAVIFRKKIEDWGVTFLVGEFAVFFVIMIAGYVYVWHRRGFEWN